MTSFLYYLPQAEHVPSRVVSTPVYANTTVKLGPYRGASLPTGATPTSNTAVSMTTTTKVPSPSTSITDTLTSITEDGNILTRAYF